MNSLRRFFAVALSLFFCASVAGAQSPSKPVTGSELLALVAGQSFDANVIHEMETRGLAFRPSEHFRALLRTAGGTDIEVAAMDKAKLSPSAGDPEQKENPELLRHIATAGMLMKAEKYEDAAKELDAALNIKITPGAGFVMATLQERTQDWDTAAAIYSKVLDMSPDFPGAHARLSYDALHLGDIDTALHEAHAAITQNPNNSEGHLRMAMGLMNADKFDAALFEFKEALRLKPDYAAAHYDLGMLYSKQHKFDLSIPEYKKAISLEPKEAEYHYGLAIDLDDSGDLNGSVREYYEAKRIDPSRIDIRNNLAGVLEVTDRPAAIREYLELIAMAPNFEYAYLNLGIALIHSGEPKEAETELRKAVELDPSDANAYMNLGSSLEHQGKFDSALKEYLHSSQLDPGMAKAHRGLGAIYLDLKDYPASVREFRICVNLAPSDWTYHDLLAQSLDITSDLDGAIAEEKESLRMVSNNPPVLARLAGFLEKKGDFAGALEQCHQVGQSGVYIDDATRADCDALKKCLTASAAPLAPANTGAGQGSSVSAAENVPSAKGDFDAILPRPAVVRPNENVESEWRQSRDAGAQALMAGEFKDAQKTLGTAVSLAEMLSPKDDRLTQTIGLYAVSFQFDSQWPKARLIFQVNLDLAEQMFGLKSVKIVGPLTEYGKSALSLKDYTTAEGAFLRAFSITERNLPPGDYYIAVSLQQLGSCYEAEDQFVKAEDSYQKALEIAEKNLTPNDYRIADSLAQLGDFYQARKAYEKAEPLLLRAYAVDAHNSGGEGGMPDKYIGKMISLYNAWGQFDKAEPFCRKMLALFEQQYGVQSPRVVGPIQSLAEVLDKEGKTEEAANLRKRSDAIQSASAAKNP